MHLKFYLFLILLAVLSPALLLAQSASLDYTLRAEDFGSLQGQIPRDQILLSCDMEFENVKLYADGFFETDQTPALDRWWRRSVDRGYLQEAYIETSWSSFFLRVGRRAARWSESWIAPSLDVWTARRYDRLYLDPLPQQLAHSTGAILSFVKPTWSVDLALMEDVAQDSFPQPIPQTFPTQSQNTINPGLRIKAELWGIQSSWVAAQASGKNTAGFGVNYAFDKFVPKAEFGLIRWDREIPSNNQYNLEFASFGADIFISDWTITPQATSFGNNDPTSPLQAQVIYYLAATYTHDKHELQFMGYGNSYYIDQFASLTYTYYFKNSWGLSLLAQNYQGNDNSITQIVQNQTGGSFYGIRVQYNGSINNNKGGI